MGRNPIYRDDCIKLLEQGFGVRQIARQLGCSPMTVMRYKRWARVPEVPAAEVPGLASTGSDRGRELLWGIASDPTAPQSARVQAVDKLREVEEWGARVEHRRLPAPLGRDELIERQLALLESLSPEVLGEVLERARAFMVPEGHRSPETSASGGVSGSE